MFVPMMMKLHINLKRSLGLIFFLMSISSFAQSDVDSLGIRVAQLDSAKDEKTWNDLFHAFENLSSERPAEWLPVYYEGYSVLQLGMLQKESRMKDKYYDQATRFAALADSLNPHNAEILILRCYAACMKITVDPYNRGQKFGILSRAYLDSAMQISPDNPRALYLRGVSDMYTPIEYGGGKKIALPTLEAAVNKFSTEKPDSPVAPHWGADMAMKMLEECRRK